MKGRVNGLKKLIMEESPSTYYVHCFAHQLQLTLVVVAKENIDCSWFFGQLAYLLNVLGMSCKQISMLRVAQAEYMIEALSLDEIETGHGLNQEMGIAKPGNTRWWSHYRTIMHVMALYPSINKVLSKIGKEHKGGESIGAQTMIEVFKSFEFVFMLHLMKEIFGYTNGWCNALQRREQDVVNANGSSWIHKGRIGCWEKILDGENSLIMSLLFVRNTKLKLLTWMQSISLFRETRSSIEMLSITIGFMPMFLGVIDMQLVEPNNRFDEVNTKLLRCMASFNPSKNFDALNAEKLVKLAGFYP
jgi:hypothetical protein